MAGTGVNVRTTDSTRSDCSGHPARSGRRRHRRCRAAGAGEHGSRGLRADPRAPLAGRAARWRRARVRAAPNQTAASISTWSTIPMMAASTGAAFWPIASPAARPSSTIRTLSRTPAPTPSTASSDAPRGVSSRFRGWTSSSLAPSNFRCFCVATTVPMTLASCTALSSDVRAIDDADDARINRGLDRIERKAGFLAAHEKDNLAGAGAHRIHGDERPSHRLPLRGQRLHDEQLDAHEALILAGGHDVADDAG